MTTTPPTTLDSLYGTAEPLTRAQQLTTLAQDYATAGNASQARLLHLLSDTEAMLLDPDAEPVTADDPAWEDDNWWRLAGTHDRQERAELIRELWRDWALQHIGDDADILLEVAQSEQALAGATAELDIDLLEQQLASHLTDADAPKQETVEEPPAQHDADGDEDADEDTNRSRAKPRAVLWMLPAAVATVVLFALVAAPPVGPSLKFFAAAALALLVIGGVVVLVFRGGMR